MLEKRPNNYDSKNPCLLDDDDDFKQYCKCHLCIYDKKIISNTVENKKIISNIIVNGKRIK